MAHSNIKTRGWLYTLNNYTKEEEEAAQGLPTATVADVIYTCYGQEEAPTTGTPHLQGYVYFKNAVRRSTLQTILPRAIWLPSTKKEEGPWWNFQYCSKTRDRDLVPNEVFWEWGIRPQKPINYREKGSRSMSVEEFESMLTHMLY